MYLRQGTGKPVEMTMCTTCTRRDCNEACRKSKSCKGFNWIEPKCQLLNGRLIMEDSNMPGAVAGISYVHKENLQKNI